jgi:uncharacterized protein
MKMDRVESGVITGAVGLAVLLAEWLLMQEYFIQGLLLYSTMLILLLIYGAYRWSHPKYRLVVLAIPAVVRLLAFTLPLGNLSPIFAQLMLSVPVGLTAVVYVRLFEQKWPTFRFHRRHAPYYVLMVIIGTGVGLLLYPPQNTAWWEVGGSLLIPVFYGFVLLLMVFLEEWLFRDIMQTALTDMWPRVGMNNLVAAVVTAVFYTLLILNNTSWLLVLFTFSIALALSWLRYKSDSLLPVFLLHGTANLFIFLILPVLGSPFRL